MNRKLLRHLEKQFGANWSCACRTPFDPVRFEILTESQNAFLAHYICAVCGREQMLAAALSAPFEDGPGIKIRNPLIAAITANDVLEIQGEIKKTQVRGLKALLKTSFLKGKTATDVDTLLKSPRI